MSAPKVFFEVTEVSWRNRHYQPLSLSNFILKTLNYNKFNKEEKSPLCVSMGSCPNWVYLNKVM